MNIHFQSRPLRAVSASARAAGSRRALFALTPVAWSCLLLLASGAASAQTASTDTTTLDPVIVTAARIAQKQSEALRATSVITAEDIRNAQATDLPTLLRDQAGIQLTRNGGPGQGTSLFMRGANSTESLILIDGVPVRRDAIGSIAALEAILPEQIDHIEIVRGNVSAIYGSGAIGGVIQIFTRKAAAKPTFGVSGEVGSRGTYKGTVDLSGTTGDVSYALAATRFRTNGFSALNTAQAPSANPDRNSDGNTSFAGSLGYRIDGNNDIGARLYMNDSKYTFDDAFGTPADQNNGRSMSRVLSVSSHNQINSMWLSTVTLSQNVNHDDTDSISLFGNSHSGYKNTANLVQWQNEIALNQNWKAIAGVDFGHDRSELNSASAFGSSTSLYTRNRSSEYAGINGTIGQNELQVNLRHDQVGGSGSDTTGYLGYGYALTPAFKLLASASTAFNAPTTSQLYQPIYGNSNLKAERARSYELGAQYSMGGSVLRATYFDTRIHNQFDYDPVTFQVVNVDRSKNHGLELTLDTRMAGLDVHGSLTFQDPQNQSTGQQLVRRAKVLGALSATKTLGAWKVGGDLSYTDTRPDINGAPVLAPYWLANLNARYQINQQLSVFGRVENIFNRNYQTAYSYNQASRGVFAGFEWRM